jgi:hypothetical protein
MEGVMAGRHRLGKAGDEAGRSKMRSIMALVRCDARLRFGPKKAERRSLLRKKGFDLADHVRYAVQAKFRKIAPKTAIPGEQDD